MGRKSRREAIRRSNTTVKCIPPRISSMRSKKAITGSSDHGTHQNRQKDRQVPRTETRGEGNAGAAQRRAKKPGQRHMDAREARAPRGADRLDLQNKDAG